MTLTHDTDVLQRLVIDLAQEVHVDVVGLEGVGLLAKADRLQLFANRAHDRSPDATGQGSVIAARLALEDYLKGNPNSELKVEIIFADCQNKPDLGASIARHWYEDDGVDSTSPILG